MELRWPPVNHCLCGCTESSQSSGHGVGVTFTDQFNQFLQQNNFLFTAYKYTHVYVSTEMIMSGMIMFYKVKSDSRNVQVIKDTCSEEATYLCMDLEKGSSQVLWIGKGS